jgi:short chain dehydrogenase
MNGNLRFEDKIVAITGASSGIGRASALAFAREGATTVLASRSEEKLERVADEIRSFNSRVLVIPTDVSVREQVQHLVRFQEYSRLRLIAQIIDQHVCIDHQARHSAFLLKPDGQYWLGMLERKLPTISRAAAGRAAGLKRQALLHNSRSSKPVAPVRPVVDFGLPQTTM